MCSVHVTHRGNNKMDIFEDDYDREVFLWFLATMVRRFAIQIHSFALMSTHHHLIVTPNDGELPRAMKSLGGRHTRYFNRKYSRCGTIWGESYRSSVIEDERYALTCLRYVEQNPVRAKMVSSPSQYRWSSYGAYADGRFPAWLTPLPAYLGLGSTPAERQRLFRSLCETSLSDQELVQQRYDRGPMRVGRPSDMIGT